MRRLLALCCLIALPALAGDAEPKVWVRAPTANEHGREEVTEAEMQRRFGNLQQSLRFRRSDGEQAQARGRRQASEIIALRAEVAPLRELVASLKARCERARDALDPSKAPR